MALCDVEIEENSTAEIFGFFLYNFKTASIYQSGIMKQVYFGESYTFYTIIRQRSNIYFVTLHLPGHIHVVDIRRLFNEMD